MAITNSPPLSTEKTSLADTKDLADLWGPDSPSPSAPSSPLYDKHSQTSEPDMVLLYRQMELRLENVVEKLLVSKVDENDNLLASMQALMDRVFVTSAMRMAQGNISRAAKLLGINRNTLSKKLKVVEAGG